MAYLAEHRDKLFVSAVGLAEIEVSFSGDEAVVGLYCAACNFEMIHDDGSELNECRECGIEVTNNESVELARRYAYAILDRFGVPRPWEGKGFLWRLRTLFGATRKRQALLKQ